MPIHGLVTPEVTPKPQFIDNASVAAVTTEALSILGLITDRDEALESIGDDYFALNELTLDAHETGELYVDIPYNLISTQGMIDAINNHGGKNYPKTAVYDNLWTPGTQAGSYTDEQLAKASGNEPTAKLALHSDEASEEPLLHFLNLPFDDYAKKQWNPDAEKTQIEAIAEQKDALETVYPEFIVSALGHRAFLLLGLQRRITGQKMPLTWGYMRDANLPRTTVGGSSVVGGVRSYDGQLYLLYSAGDADPGAGVGLSVGQKS